MSMFTTHRKTTLLLPDDVVAEIHREILRTPKYWAERIFSIVCRLLISSFCDF